MVKGEGGGVSAGISGLGIKAIIFMTTPPPVGTIYFAPAITKTGIKNVGINNPR